MALCRTVGLTLKSVLANPCFIVPSSVNLQVRHAARKGYREKKKTKKAFKPVTATKELAQDRTKFTNVERTFNLKKPEPPNDDVFIKADFNHKKFPLREIINFHKEYHHPTVYNNKSAPIFLKIEINMIGKKQTQFLKPFSGVAAIPHPFVLKKRKEVLVFCSPEDKEMALSCGASIAGGPEVVKKIQEGLIQPSMYDYIISHSSLLSTLNPLRTVLKTQMPKAKLGTLTNDLGSAIHRFLHGIEYSCVKHGDSQDFGVVHCSIGTVGMEVEQLESNFKAVVEDIERQKPPREGEFITWIWCMSPPSTEEFPVDLSEYIEASELQVDDDDDDDVHELKERDVAKTLKREYEEQKMMN